MQKTFIGVTFGLVYIGLYDWIEPEDPHLQ